MWRDGGKKGKKNEEQRKGMSKREETAVGQKAGHTFNMVKWRTW